MRLVILLALLMTTPLVAQDVVVSKYFNGGNKQSAIGDTVELTVIKDGFDMQGYTLRDFAIISSTNTFTTDPFTSGSGYFHFANIPFWQKLRAGTIIILPYAADEAQWQGDTVVMVGLLNMTYFIRDGGTFNIAESDMIMLKRVTTSTYGTEGNIHALSAGLTIKDVSGIVPLVRTSDDASGARPYAVPDNIAGNLSDYNSSRAGTVAYAPFGRATNAANQRFLDSLRRSRTSLTSVVAKPSLYRLRLAPIPASKDCEVNFRIDAADTVIISVLDMLGNSQILYHFYHTAGDQSIRVSLANVAQGAYFLVIKTNNAEWREKISVVR